MASSRRFNIGITILNILIIIIFLNSTASSLILEPSCPMSCQCENSFINCSKRELYYVPYGISWGFKKVYLSFNNIEEIPEVDFEKATFVTQLNLEHNNIYSISPLAFYNMKRLVVLDLSYNKITYLDINLFENNYNIKFLSLEGNKFTNFDFTIKSNSLQVLNLENCMISKISLSTFSNLPNLEALYLGNNFISTLSIDAIRPMPKLKYLSLWNDELCHPESFTELIIYLRENEIVYSPSAPCKQQNNYGFNTWEDSGNSEKRIEYEENIFDDRNTIKLYSEVLSWNAIRNIIIAFLFFSVGVFICVLIVCEYWMSKRKVRDPENCAPSAPPVSPFEDKENMPWYKMMLKLLLFQLPHDKKENATDGGSGLSNKLEQKRETIDNGNNNRY